jgi:hypothetical protein
MIGKNLPIENKLYQYLESTPNPLTGMISYYSGTVALNLFDSKESGDWHMGIKNVRYLVF